MSQISDLKGGIDKQFKSALDIIAIARLLNDVKRQLVENGQAEQAERIEQAVNRLADISESMIEAAKVSGRSLADITRSSW